VEDEEDDLREMKVKSCREKANDREEWASVVKEAKVPTGSCQGLSRYLE
jgi:hypothetical protein